MVVHAAFGGSTNLLIHLPALAHAAGLKRPAIEDWTRINKKVPRLVDVLPNGPIGHPTVQVFLAGGVPEVMLKLRDLGLLHLDVMTVSGEKLDSVLDKWENSDRRKILKQQLMEKDNVDPDDVIMSSEKAAEKGLTSTVTFPVGNISPEGSVIKSTAIDPTLLDENGVYKKVGNAKVFYNKRDAITAIKSDGIKPGNIMLVICAGPMGSGMEETYEVTAALKHVSWGKHVALLTDARFSGVSTGACIGHIGPEALAGGPIGKLKDNDIIEIIVDCKKSSGTINLLGEADENEENLSVENGTRILELREPNSDLTANAGIPDDTRLWAALQDISGGTWGGCVYDTEKILEILAAGKEAISNKNKFIER
jgi:putative YjhG/YagF family dehydratase